MLGKTDSRPRIIIEIASTLLNIMLVIIIYLSLHYGEFKGRIKDLIKYVKIFFEKGPGNVKSASKFYSNSSTQKF